MRSPAYRDFVLRAAEARLLVREAVDASKPTMASVFAKSAAVVTAAALERYFNDFLSALCRRINVDKWDQLSEGEKQYLAYQVAVRVRSAAGPLVSRKQRDRSEASRTKLNSMLTASLKAFEEPKSWTAHRSYGMFMDGAAEPGRIDATLRLFLTDGRGLFDRIEDRGRDRAALATALEGLISARHRVAHALVGPDVGPTDARLWLLLCFILVREVEDIVWSREQPGTSVTE